ncbi:hypothetical protein HYU07_05360 [Candidatus Woesearchaeota archaeon]|nr:hypothetical protein [Candidatus Woesearchaeota archaeon]
MICKLMEFNGKGHYVALGYCLPKDQYEDIASMPGVFKKKEDDKTAFYIKEKDLDKRIKENYRGLAKLLFRLSSPD